MAQKSKKRTRSQRLRKEARAVRSKGRVLFGASRRTPPIVSGNVFTDLQPSTVAITLGVEGGWTGDPINAEAHADLTSRGLVFAMPSYLSGRSSRFTSCPF